MVRSLSRGLAMLLALNERESATVGELARALREIELKRDALLVKLGPAQWKAPAARSSSRMAGPST